MKRLLFIIALCIAGIAMLKAQDVPLTPSLIGTGQYLGLSQPLGDLPVITPEEFQQMAEEAYLERNEELRERSYPYEATALPKGPDAVWQKQNGENNSSKAPIVTFDGQSSPYFPPDDNGAVGPNHFMQTINSVYAIYNKTGTLVAGPTNMNLLFSGVTGATCNDGDPIVLYDEMADRWFAAEFSICGSNDYMLMAVSQTNDPTGSWYKYSFDVDDMPDYEKFGIWPDGYYMGTNNSGAGKKDIYVFERTKMLSGLTAQMVGFDNSWRPTTIDGFMCVPPVDNDGTAAPTGAPGLFITINDDAIAGGSDQLWIYELAVNWTTPSSSTFSRVQQLAVTAFDSNFGADWTNIKQQGSTQELDAIPQVVMNAPQYRNFGTYQTLVCCHTVDVDNTDHAGVRWYELRKTTGTWSVRQQGTYAPDAHSRWMGSIRLNSNNEIGLGYSISSSTLYPGIRYCGQSSTAYATGAETMDVTEAVITTGTYSQSTYERWGDYSSIAIDPSDGRTFWYTNQYVGTSNARKTRIASFQISAPPTQPDLITQTPAASPTTVVAGSTTTASVTVKNQGTASAGASNLKYYLSANTTWEATDTYLAVDAIAILAAGATSAVSELVTIPSATTAGAWYILFRADADATVTESNETNNVGYIAITVTVSSSGCNSTTQYPSTTLTVTTAWKTQNSIYAGEYCAFSVTSGKTYTFSLCSTDGASATYDSELTLRNKTTDAFLAYSDDYCGDDAKIIWTATFTGTVKLVVTQYNCATNSTSTKLRYKRTAKEAELPEISTEQEFSVYPNPTNSVVYIETPGSFDPIDEVLVYNINGSLVKRIGVSDKSIKLLEINLDNMPAGYYTIKMLGSSYSKHTKIIVTD